MIKFLLTKTLYSGKNKSIKECPLVLWSWSGLPCASRLKEEWRMTFFLTLLWRDLVPTNGVRPTNYRVYTTVNINLLGFKPFTWQLMTQMKHIQYLLFPRDPYFHPFRVSFTIWVTVKKPPSLFLPELDPLLSWSRRENQPPSPGTGPFFLYYF